MEQDLSQLYKDQFDNIKSNYENQIDLSEYLRDSEEKTYTQSTKYFDDMRGVYSKNLKLLISEAKDLERQLQKAVDDGAVEVGSEAWQEMKKDINSVTKEIAKTNVELAKLYTEQFDYIQNNYQNQISSYESLNDANEKSFTATTNYYKEMREISNKTLKAQQDELADLEKEFDKAMDSGRIQEGSDAWYKMCGAIDDTTRAISKTRVELKQLYLDEFDYIQSGYQNQLSLYDHYASIYSKKSTLLETQGYMTSGKLLSYQKGVQEKNIGTLKEELVSLESELNEAINKGDIDQYSDAWYNMTSSINAVKEAIYDAKIETEQLNKAIQQLDWDTFDLQQEMTGQINDESDFLISVMGYTDLYDKKGRLTDTGLATMALRNVKADTYNKQSHDYLVEMTDIELKLFNDPNNTDLLKRRQELIKLSRESALALENEQKAIVSMVEDGIKVELDALKELIDTYKSALDSAKDLYDYQSQLADKSSNIAKIQKQLSAYTNDTSEETKATVQKLQVELSEAQKDLRDTEYARSVSDQKKLLDEIYTEYESFLNARLDDTNRILEDMRLITNAIPGQIGEVLRDVSNSASLHISSELNGIFVNGQKQLDAYNASHESDRQITIETLNEASGSWGSFGENLRGSVLDAYSETNGKIGAVGDKSDTIKTTVDYNAHGIETIFSNLENRGGQIIANSDDNAKGIINYIGSKDNSIKINNNFTTTIDSLKKIEQHVDDIADEANKRINTFYMGDVDFDESVTSSDALAIMRNGVGIEDFDGKQIALADLDGDGVITANDALLALRMGIGLEDSKKTKSFSTGGLADYTGIASIHGTKSKPELVLNARDTQNFIKLNDILREVMKAQGSDLLGTMYGIDSPALQLAKMPSLVSGMNAANQTQDVQIVNNIEIDHVENYDDLVRKLRTDTKFENMITSMTIGKLNGGRSIDKYKYRW